VHAPSSSWLWHGAVRPALLGHLPADASYVIVAVYPNDAQLLDRLRELIAAEAECCSFLRFSVEETPDATLTELRLPEELPESMRTRVVALFG
jgi:hypothetical protein